MKISRTTAAQSDAIPARRPPRVSARTPTIPVTVARRTLGSGRASTRKPRIASSPTAGTARARKTSPSGGEKRCHSDESDVAARDSDEVGQPSGLAVVREIRRQPGGVAVDQSGQQAALVGRQDGGRTSQSATQSRRDPLQRGRGPDPRGWTASRDNGSQVTVTGPRCLQSAGHLDVLAGHEMRPSSSRRRGRGPGRGSTMPCRAPRCVRVGR